MAKSDEGRIFPTNKSGDLIIVEYMETKRVLVEFINTGTRKITSMGQINCGQVGDRYARTVCGIGFLGEGHHKSPKDNASSDYRKYHAWVDMLYRCYSERTIAKNPSYVGCIVCDEWHNYQTFGDWYDNHYVDGYELDKDGLGCGKLYSPSTCQFISQTDNVQLATGTVNRVWVFEKGGELKRVDVLTRFAEELGVYPSAVHAATIRHDGDWCKTVKGWSFKGVELNPSTPVQ